MRIIAGKHKNKALADSREFKDLHPITEKTREALFSILENSPIVKEHGFELFGANVLDIFCCTGAVALEALSRGAAFVTMIDSNPRNIELARKNTKILDEESSAEIMQLDVARSLPKAKRKYDLIFIDLPYKENEVILKALNNLQKSNWLTKDNLVVIEHNKDGNIELPEEFTFLEKRNYGKNYLSFFCFNCGKE